jgi:hypothetical protein
MSISPDQSAARLEARNLKNLDLVAFNGQAEYAFVTILPELITSAGGGLPAIEVYREMSYRLDVSPITIKRYLLKHTASIAEFRLVGDLVVNRESP